MKSRQYLIIIIVFLLSFSSCNIDKTIANVIEESTNIEGFGLSDQESFSDLKREGMIFHVEGVINSCFFYHLHE